MNFFKKLLHKILPEKNDLQDKPVEMTELNEPNKEKHAFQPVVNISSEDIENKIPRKRKTPKAKTEVPVSFDQADGGNLACFSSELIDTFKRNPTQTNMQLVAYLTKAVKFRIPDGGRIIDINKDGSLIDNYSGYIPVIKLPYEIITLECKVFSIHKTPMVILCRQLEGVIEFAVFLKNMDLKKWTWMGGEFIPITCDWNKMHYLQIPKIKNLENEETAETLSMFFMSTLEIIFQFLAAMNCFNAEIVDDVKPDERLNKSRIRKGKTPMFEYKVLTIRTQRNGLSKLLGGKHASPRVHLRRGHIRKLKAKTVWVNACVVGDKSRGIIQKEYLVN